MSPPFLFVRFISLTVQSAMFCAPAIWKSYKLSSDSSVEIGGLSEGLATLWVCFYANGNLNFDSFEVISIYRKCPSERTV